MLGPPVNTVIPHLWMATNPTLHQAHLECVSDFLQGLEYCGDRHRVKLSFLMITTVPHNILKGQIYTVFDQHHYLTLTSTCTINGKNAV